MCEPFQALYLLHCRRETFVVSRLKTENAPNVGFSLWCVCVCVCVCVSEGGRESVCVCERERERQR